MRGLLLAGGWPARRGAGWLAAAAVGVAWGTSALAQSAAQPPVRSAVSDIPAAGIVQRAPLNPTQFDGAPISLVFLDLLGGTGDSAQDQALRARIEGFALPIGSGPFSPPVADFAIAGIRALPGVRNVSYSLYASERPGNVVVVVSATLVPQKEVETRGAIASGRLSDLPILVEDQRSLLRVQLNAGIGTYADHNPWFGSAPTYTSASPIATDPPGPGWANWAEAWVEYGLAGATRLGDTNGYAFGEATMLTSGTVGQDLFSSQTRSQTLPEKLYAGALWAEPGTGRSARLTLGRVNWQLDDGFLFSRFAAGANAGPNASLYLNPRTTYQMAALADVRVGRFKAEAFDLDPAELQDYDSDTRFQGLHAAWFDKEAWDLGLTGYRVRTSKTVFRDSQGNAYPRQGQRTVAGRLGYWTLAGVPGLSALGEYAYQTHSDVPWSAHAWYAQIAYTARQYAWLPSLTYRFASFSGDNPNTPTREAFDAPMSSGLDKWVQGVNFKKIVTNSNLNTHRVRLYLSPSDRVNYTFDYFRLCADVPNAAGQRQYGDEINLALRWAISRQLYFLAVAGIGWPGEVIKAQTQGAAKPWSTLQASLFVNF
jgi:hypothetical protein